MTLQEIFVENLESEMAKKNVTYYQISKNTNIAHSTFSKWKNRKANPTIDTLLTVCKYLNVSADKLLGLPEPEPPNFTEEEIYLIECFRQADNVGKEMIRRTCKAEGNEKFAKSSNFEEKQLNNVNAQNRKAQ